MKKNVLIVFVLLLIISCHSKKKITKSDEKKVPIILVSKDFNGKFPQWLNTIDSSFVYVNLYAKRNTDSIDYFLKNANGIIISGGEDVNPDLYGKKSEIERCGTIDNFRDSLEQIMLNFALSNDVPLLAVCRGEQILNVNFGGTLFIDIPTDIGSKTLHRNKGRTTHTVYIDKTSYLYQITKIDSGIVLSNHHQAVEILADDFKASAFAKDKVIEAIELEDTTTHRFVLGVQWHPEAMEKNNPLSYNIGKIFLYKVKIHFSDKK